MYIVHTSFQFVLFFEGRPGDCSFDTHNFCGYQQEFNEDDQLDWEHVMSFNDSVSPDHHLTVGSKHYVGPPPHNGELSARIWSPPLNRMGPSCLQFKYRLGVGNYNFSSREWEIFNLLCTELITYSHINVYTCMYMYFIDLTE